MEKELPPGFRFHPTDEELVSYYLTNKVADSSFVAKAITVVDLNRCEPWDLPGKASMGERVWYFFCLKDRKYPTGLRTNRATEAGYWKTTGKDKQILATAAGAATLQLVGMKKTLVFYKGRAPKGEKTNWVMHEYRLSSRLCTSKLPKEEWVVCRVFKKTQVGRRVPAVPSLQESPSANFATGQGDEPLENNHFTESNSEFSEITRVLGNSEGTNNIENETTNLASSICRNATSSNNVDKPHDFEGNESILREINASQSSWFNLNYPMPLTSNFLKMLQMNVVNNYLELHGAANACFNAIVPSDHSSGLRQQHVDMESLWSGCRTSLDDY